MIHVLEDILKKFESARCEARKAHCHAARFKIRRHTIVDLPAEILLRIFEIVKSTSPNEIPNLVYSKYHPRFTSTHAVRAQFDLDPIKPGHHVEDKSIQAVRLTCRRFCNMSSHLLLTAVNVSMTRSSIARLDEVSRHPLISKGVRFMQIHVTWFSSEKSAYLGVFATACIAELQWQMGRHEPLLAWDDYGFVHQSQSARHRNRMERLKDLARTWEPLMDVHDDGTAYLAHPPAMLHEDTFELRLIHSRYRQKWLEQESLCRDGSLFHSIAAAMARMPAADRLCITDVDDELCLDLRHRQYGLRAVDHVQPEGLAKYIAAGMIRSDGDRAQGLTKLHLKLLEQLPPTIFAAGTSLRGLHVKMLGSKAYHLHVPEDRLAKLAVSCKDLTNFEFKVGVNYSVRADRISSENASSLRSLLAALAVSTDIQHLSLELGVQDYHSGWLAVPLMSFGTCLSGPSWPNLRSMTLKNVTFHLPEVRKFLAKLGDGDKVDLDLREMCLLGDGTWADVLDLLREKSTALSYIDDLYGGELGGLGDFPCKNIHSERLISYITGQSDDNPLVLFDWTESDDDDEILDW